MAIANSTSPNVQGGVSAPARQNHASIPDAVRKGMASAHAMLCLIEETVNKQVEEDGDYNIPKIAQIYLDMLPNKDSDEAIGYAFTMGEYLASLADGIVLVPNFKPSKIAGWNEVHHG